jgi:hypothetical protein
MTIPMSEREPLMTLSRRRLLTSVCAVAAVLVAAGPGVAGTSASAASRTVADWEMNEAKGATVMTDSSGNGLTGSIGSMVTTGVGYAGATGYRFSYVTPNTPPAYPQKLVTVPENDLLDPGTSDFTLTIRYRTTHGFGNIIQKGQATSSGGQWKLQAPKGILQCVWTGSLRKAAMGSPTALDDGSWHTVVCENTGTRIGMSVDGGAMRWVAKTTGSINNSRPVSIGGKTSCDQVNVTCDYFAGDIDYVRIQKG